jgi:hypothetical protein
MPEGVVEDIVRDRAAIGGRAVDPGTSWVTLDVLQVVPLRALTIDVQMRWKVCRQPNPTRDCHPASPLRTRRGKICRYC